MSRRPLASVSLDLDNLWSYLKTHGDPGWESRPSYLSSFIPIALEQLAQLDLRITVFVVGVDAARAENREALASLVTAGHEVGNHSHEHEPWLHRYTPADLDDEVARAEAAIEAATGQRPVGFRGPGFSWSPALLEVLAARGYRYDASTLPTYLGPLARAYYFRTAKLTREARAEREHLFGGFSEGLRPNKPYHWRLRSGGRLLEIPVTTMPVFKTPFHLSYLLYLARFSEAAMEAYLRTAVTMCRLTGTEPSFLLHPLDLLGGDLVPELEFFPGMDLPSARKLGLFRRSMEILAETYDLVPLGVHAAAAAARPEVVRRTKEAA